MEGLFLIGEAAKAVNVTSETLRHYDRIGLVKPSHKDKWTSYRYYTEKDIVKINTVRALQQMDLPLQKIKEVLAFDDLEKIVDYLTAAEKMADEKIALLQCSKAKIQLVKLDYESKLSRRHHTEGIYIKHFKRRVIMISGTLETPTLDNLWGYLRHFYDKVDPLQKEEFVFEDLAGIYTENNLSRLFAVCIRYLDVDGLKVLPEGDYLCADCTEENRNYKLAELLQVASGEYHVTPKFSVSQIVISGILQWNYQAQVFLG